MNKRRIVFVYNTGEYLLRLRSELLVELVASGHEVYGLFPFDDATSELEQLGVHCINLSMTPHSLTPWRELYTIHDLRQQLRRLQPDVVFAFTIKPIVYAGLNLPRSSGTRFCVMITGLGMMFAGVGVKGWLARKLATALYRRTLSKADVVFMQNTEHSEAFVNMKLITRSQVRLIPGSGVNLQRFRQQPISTRRPVFVLITRMLEHKGVRDFVDAAKHYLAAGRAGQFILAGPVVQGPHAIDAVDLDRLVQDSPVEYLGAVEDVAGLLARASIVVLPSVYPEGVPRILLEALAVGRPIITTDTPGCRSTVSLIATDECNKSADNPVICAPETQAKRASARFTGDRVGERSPTDPAGASDDNVVAGRSVDVRPILNAADQRRGAEDDDVEDESAPWELSDIHGKVGKNGVLCDPVAPQALLNCMIWMASLPPQRWQQMGNAGRELVETRYDVRDVNREIRERLFTP